MSQERLAELAGLTNGYISQIETGKRGKRPSREAVLAIAQALQRPAAPLLRAAGRLQPGDEGDESPGFSDVVARDRLLRADQKDILTRLYAVFVRGTVG